MWHYFIIKIRKIIDYSDTFLNMGGFWNIIVFHGSVVLYKMVSFSNIFKLAIFAQSGVLTSTR